MVKTLFSGSGLNQVQVQFRVRIRHVVGDGSRASELIMSSSLKVALQMSMCVLWQARRYL